jgi:hypothetical protein
MCLIALRTTDGSHIPNHVIDWNHVSNPDGFGLMWRDDGEVKTAKYAPQEFEYFRNKLKALDNHKVEYGAHWRNATHGATSRELAHPYEYVDADGLPIALMHNGIIDIATTPKESDTLAFVEQVLARLHTGWWNQPEMRFLVEQAIGWSRLLLFTPDETVVINDDAWKVEDSIRYSTEPIPKYEPYIWKGNNGKAKTNGKADNWAGWEGYAQAAWTDYDLPALLEGGKVIDDGLFEDKMYDLTNEVTWKHEGHTVFPLEPLIKSDLSKDDVVGTCFCDACDIEGEFYVIDGKTYIDLDHKKKVGFKTKAKTKVKAKRSR